LTVEDLQGVTGGKNLMEDLHATYNDATSMVDFLYNVICLDVRDITIMSDQMDYNRLFEKPEFQGDFLKQMFDWNLNKKEADMKTKEFHDAISVKEGQKSDDNWDEFEAKIAKAKFTAKHKVK
jgi:hypothetical protein